jgi:hypothetical protein
MKILSIVNQQLRPLLSSAVLDIVVDYNDLIW